MNELTKTEEFDEKKISEILECLKKSPTFNMSRGGRELFHTNFLAFILDAEYEGDDCQSYEAQVKKLILKKLFWNDSLGEEQQKIPENVITFRERSNLDLIVIPALKELTDKKQVVVIEAKLKSIPTAEQLEKYNKKFDSSFKLALFDELEFKTVNRKNEEYDFTVRGIELKFSKAITDFCTVSLIADNVKGNSRPKQIDGVKLKRLLLAPMSIVNIDLKGWDLLDWSDFLNNIKPDENKCSLKEKSIFGQLIEDYLKSTNSLLSLVELVNKQSQQFVQEIVTWSDFLTFAVNRNDFKRMRLHDLVGKVTYHSLQNKLIRDLNHYKQLKKTIEGFNLDSYTFYSRSQAGIGIQYKMSKGKQAYSLGIQLQGNNYRHFIERNNCINPKLDLVSCADIIKSWICINKNEAKPQKNNGFGVFDKTKFVYQHIKLGVSATGNSNEAKLAEKPIMYSDLLAKIKSSLNEAIQEIGKDKFLSKFVVIATSENETHNGG